MLRKLTKPLSPDPIEKHFPELTPYQYASNRPIDGIDMDGLEYTSAAKWVRTNMADYSIGFDYDQTGNHIRGYTQYKGENWKSKLFKNTYGQVSMACNVSMLIAMANGNTKVASYLKLNGQESFYPQFSFFQKGGEAHSLIKPNDFQKATTGDILFMENPNTRGKPMEAHEAMLNASPIVTGDNMFSVDMLSTNAGASNSIDGSFFGKVTYNFEKTEAMKDDKGTGVFSWQLVSKDVQILDENGKATGSTQNFDMRKENLRIMGFGRIDEEKITGGK